MDFNLTEEQQMVREMARRFAEAEIKPVEELARYPGLFLPGENDLSARGVQGDL